MNYNETALIHRQDYLRHVTDEVILHMLLQALLLSINDLPESADKNLLLANATGFGELASILYDHLMLPEDFPAGCEPGNYVEAFSELMENELLDVSDDDRPCCAGERCCEYAERVEKELSEKSDKPDATDDDTECAQYLDRLYELTRMAGELLKIADGIVDFVRNAIGDDA